MARKKSTKQKQKQKQSVRQSVSQKVVVQVGQTTARRRRAPRRKTGGGGGGGGGGGFPPAPFPQQPPPQPPAFMDASALEMNARLGLFGEQLGGLMSQEEARQRQAERHMDAVEHLTNLARTMMIGRPATLPPAPIPVVMERRRPVLTESETKLFSIPSEKPEMAEPRQVEEKPEMPVFPHERAFAKHAEAEKSMGVASGSFGNPFGNPEGVLSASKASGSASIAPTEMFKPSQRVGSPGAPSVAFGRTTQPKETVASAQKINPITFASLSKADKVRYITSGVYTPEQVNSVEIQLEQAGKISMGGGAQSKKRTKIVKDTMEWNTNAQEGRGSYPDGDLEKIYDTLRKNYG